MLVLAAAACGVAQPEPRDLLEVQTLEKLRALSRSTAGIIGVAAVDLSDGRELCLQCNTYFPTASTIKVPVLAEIVRQGKMDAKLRISHSDLVEGSKEFENALSKGQEIAARELALMMIRSSDNAATNKLIDLAGMAEINRFLGELDLPAIRLRRKMIDTQAAARNEENIATPREMVRLAAKLHRGDVVNAQASAGILSMMELVKGEIRNALPPAVKVAAKTGSIPGVRCEFGVVVAPNRPFAIAVYTAFLHGPSPIAEAAKILFRHYELLGRSNRSGRFLQ